MHILNIANVIKKMRIKDLKDLLVLTTLINQLYMLNKAVVIQQNVRKKDLLSFATKLMEEVFHPSNTTLLT